MKVGDKVYWGPYGEFEDARVFTITDIEENDPIFHCKSFIIKDNDDRTGFAFQDELMLVQ